MSFVVAVDGPSCSGKGTIARGVADHFGLAYLDTGLLYRAFACGNFSSADVSIQDLQKIIGETSDEVIRSDEVGRNASDVAKSPAVRDAMTKLQREFAANPGIQYRGAILDGRDIATVVLPNANCKIFITADLLVRAHRRWEFLKQINPQILLKLEEVYDSLRIRDEQDKSRKIAPLIYNESYTLLDTSEDSPEESMKKALEIVAGAIVFK
jgi:cytidylate kinase